jgi:hypothetical protein
MHRSNGFSFLALVTLCALVACIGCPTQPPAGDDDNTNTNTNTNTNDNGDDGGGDTTCGTDGDGCEGDADCCEGLVCYEWTCEPTDEVPDDNGNTNDNSSDDGVDGVDLEPPEGGLLVDHTSAAAFDDIPESAFADAKATLSIFYGHTSHGSQLVTGMNMLDTGSGSVTLEENDGVDLGHTGDLAWVDITREVLDRPDSGVNVVMWSWCAGVSDNTEEGINAYLDAMDGLESEYPGVVFVYMTGHLDGTGPSGNLYVRNNQIRDYCTSNGKVLFDFADIESYDPDGTYYPDGSDWCEWCEGWCATHTCPDMDCVDDADCAHSMCFNCYQKGRAFWWMMARLAGWE